MGHGQVRMDPSKVQAIVDWRALTCVKHVQQFLGMCNYYNQFIRNYGMLSAPLMDLLCKDRPWFWGTAQEITFAALKKALSSYPLL